ncbi:electron transporter SenC [Methylobacterium sp. Leaf456]|uniref:SCO family protein n=1 Tax=Methylobacterium sp. Leaf456 TaxID=1736382 RepID=UPI0006F38A27|nr:SCO family protein [Methylobacterium sp. Leaf456]KQT49165.1 electron transporter SenC [Methylobacterium sp. Leaf456]
MLAIRISAATLGFVLLGPAAIAMQPLPPPIPARLAPSNLSLLAGHFRLVAPDGTMVDSDALAGKPYGLFFGFTHCPDICPTTLAALSAALAQMPRTELPLYFVTVDPERDTPDVLAQYMTHFDPRIVALSGTREAIDEALASFGAVAQRTDLPGGGHVYGHTAAVLLIDGNGLIVDRLAAEEAPDRLAERLAALAEGDRPRRQAPAR